MYTVLFLSPKLLRGCLPPQPRPTQTLPRGGLRQRTAQAPIRLPPPVGGEATSRTALAYAVIHYIK